MTADGLCRELSQELLGRTLRHRRAARALAVGRVGPDARSRLPRTSLFSTRRSPGKRVPNCRRLRHFRITVYNLGPADPRHRRRL